MVLFVSLCVTQIDLSSMKQWLPSSEVLDSLSTPSPEPLSKDGEGWDEKKAHGAFCKTPESRNAGRSRSQTQYASQPGGPL